jgi:GrpB-like predicted nucleotidyltransferase (UPF0157 family)
MDLELQEYVTLEPAFHPYDAEAPIVAKMLMHVIRNLDARLQPEHIGSSSAPGCGGKGYIDLLIIYPDGLLEVAKQVLADLGFQRQGSRDPFPEDRPMRVGSIEHQGNLYPIHAHVVSASSPEVEELLWFRERLRSDPMLQRAYEGEKRRILQEGVLDGVDYAEKKGDFVQRVLAERTYEHESN